jgi:hypothetical protein
VTKFELYQQISEIIEPETLRRSTLSGPKPIPSPMAPTNSKNKKISVSYPGKYANRKTYAG